MTHTDEDQGGQKNEPQEIQPSFEARSPVDEDPSHSRGGGPTPGIALCLSGGGYRAMLFHVGALWRLNEVGYLLRLNRISSVSGGSITAGALAVAWSKLDFRDGIAGAFEGEFVAAVRRLAEHTVDVGSVLSGAVLPGSIAEKVARAYDKHLFRGATLQDLPDEVEGIAPRFIFNASNVQSGALFRFSKPYIWDWRVGKIERPRERLALAVAASSAFPPVLSPLVLKYKHSDYVPGTGADLQQPPYTTRPVLTDGGVYDNLGLETAWKRYRTILVSDAGGRMAAEASPKGDPLRHMRRVLDLIDNQVRSLRKRQVLDGYQLPRDGGNAWRDGTYWGIRTNIADYGLPEALRCPYEATMRIAAEPTRLAKMSAERQERLINWGYAVCDAAMRRWVLKDAPPFRAEFPYPNAGIG
jgi:NTE family protein